MTVSFSAKFPKDKERLKRVGGVGRGGNSEKNGGGCRAIRH
jgi:hypothetical protein